MNLTIGMTLNTIKLLDIQNKNSVLELGHDNCGHLDELLTKARGIEYFGLEVSEVMFKEAKKNKGNAVFKLFDGQYIPFKNSFLIEFLRLILFVFGNFLIYF